MKTVFDPAVRAELQHRVQLLTKDHRAQWGKMNVFQMTKHCINWSEWILGKGNYAAYTYKQDWLGKVFGKWGLRSNTKDDKPMGKNMPAGKFAIKGKVNNDLETDRWIQCIGDYAHFSNDRFIHDFFGPMTRAQIGIFSYKHYDHHLRQFGV